MTSKVKKIIILDAYYAHKDKETLKKNYSNIKICHKDHKKSINSNSDKLVTRLCVYVLRILMFYGYWSLKLPS